MGGSKIIKDAIHGYIEIPGLCVRIIDTPQFQRLRFLKQLGTASLVYPVASHNRFEHCVGTCYLAGKMVNALRSRQEEIGITEADVLCVQIAGLCHDLGHGAFSHVFETFMKESQKFFKHEEMSCKMFDHLLSENNIMQDFRRAGLDEKDVQFIKDIILGAKPSVEENGRTAAKAFLFEIVNNKRTGADVDKWDYFLRDCHGLGINVSAPAGATGPTKCLAGGDWREPWPAGPWHAWRRPAWGDPPACPSVGSGHSLSPWHPLWV